MITAQECDVWAFALVAVANSRKISPKELQRREQRKREREGLRGPAAEQEAFQVHGRDLVEQMLYGFGWRITGQHEGHETRSLQLSTVAATSCGGVTARSRSGTGVVCDESPPVVLGAPTLHAADGAAALALPSTVEVRWAGVFADGESGLASFEVCVHSSADPCAGWVAAGATGSLTVALDGSAYAAGQSVVASVRVTNGAGHVSEAGSAAMRIDGVPPTLLGVSVDGAQDGAPCVVSGDGAALVRWSLSLIHI